nr:phospholipase-like protein [Tanacetum cinerariifolium]
MDAVRVCLLIVVELVFIGKEDKNCIPRHIVSLVEDFDSWNDYPWGEYMWELFYKRTVNIVAIHRANHLKKKKQNLDYYPTYNLYGFAWAFKDSNPNLELCPTPIEKQTGWFITSIQFINGLVDEDFDVSQDDGVGVVSSNCVDLQHNFVSSLSVLLANSHERLNETRVGNNDMLLLEGGDSFLDSKRGDKNLESNKDKQPTLADVLDEVRALRKEVALVKFDDARIAKLERISNDNFMFRNDSPKELLSTCSRPDIDNAEVDGHVIGIHKADGKNDSPNVNCSDPDILDGEVVGALEFTRQMGRIIAQTLIIMSTCFSPDMDNGEVAIVGMGIHKADGKNDIWKRILNKKTKTKPKTTKPNTE